MSGDISVVSSKFSRETELIAAGISIVLAFLLIVVAGVRGEEIGNDLDVYGLIYKSIVYGDGFGIEISFVLISKIMYFFSFGFRGVVLTYALLSISIKFYSLRQCFKFKYKEVLFFLTLYLACFYPLHDLAQMRTALMLSLGLVFFSVSKPPAKIFLSLLIFLAHSSGFVIIAAYCLCQLFGRNKNSILMLLLGMIAGGVVFYLLAADFFIAYLKDSEMVGYVLATEGAENTYNYLLSPKLFIVVLTAVFSGVTLPAVFNDRVQIVEILWLSWFIVFIYCLLVLIGIPAAGFRFLEIGMFFSFVLCFFMLRCLKRKAFPVILLFSLVTIFIYTGFVAAERPLVDFSKFTQHYMDFI